MNQLYVGIIRVYRIGHNREEEPKKEKSYEYKKTKPV